MSVPPPVPPRPRISSHQSRHQLTTQHSSQGGRRSRSMSGGPNSRQGDKDTPGLVYSHPARPLSPGRHVNVLHLQPNQLHPSANGLPPTGQVSFHSRAINEENESQDIMDHTRTVSPAHSPRSPYQGSSCINGGDVHPVYFTELDIVDNLERDLQREAWDHAVDKKELSKYNKAFVKRQSVIWELWTTERNFLRTLLVLRYVYQEQMEMEVKCGTVLLHNSPAALRQLFPPPGCLDELIDLHKGFFRALRSLQGKPPLYVVEDPVGPTLCAQFQGDTGKRLAEAYGSLNAHHDLTFTRSDIYQRQPEVAAVLQRYSKHKQSNKKTLTDCYTIAIQHLSKIKTLVPALRNQTKNNPEEETSLRRADDLIHSCLSTVDRLLEIRQNQVKLQEIVQRFEPQAQRIVCGGRMWTAEELKTRKCLFAGKLEYHRERQETRLEYREKEKDKYMDCYGLLLEDALVVLREKDASEVKQGGWLYTFFSADGKDHVIPFTHCQTVIRENNTGKLTNSRQPLEFLIMVTNSKPKAVAYQFLCSSHEGRDGCMTWINRLNAAKEKCPFVSEQITKEAEEREELDRKIKTSAEIHTKLRVNEYETLSNISCHMQLLTQLLQLWGISAGTEQDLPEDSVSQANKEITRIALYVQSLGSSLTRSASNAEDRRASPATASVPKRAETFGGHDSRKPPIDVKRRGTGALGAGESDSVESLKMDSPSHSQTLTVKDHSRRRNSVSLLTRFIGGISPKTSQQNSSAGGTGQESPGVNRKSPADSRLSAESEIEHSIYSEPPVSPDQLSDAPPDSECLLALERIADLVKRLSDDVLTTRNELELLRADNQQLKEELHLEKSATARGNLGERKGYINQEHLLEAIRQQKTDLDREKRQWEESRKRDRAHIETEKESLEQQKIELRKNRDELENERKLLKEQSERLQKQIDMHRSTPDLLDTPIPDQERRNSNPQEPHHQRWHSDEPTNSRLPPHTQHGHSKSAVLHLHSQHTLQSSASTSRLPDLSTPPQHPQLHENGATGPQRHPSSASATSSSNLTLGLPKFLAADNSTSGKNKKKNSSKNIFNKGRS